MMKPYQNKECLYQRYIIEEKSILKISKKDGCSEGTIRYWLKKYNIPRRAKGAMTGEKNPMFGKHLSEGTRKKLSEAHKGEKNSQWKGGIRKNVSKKLRFEVFKRDNFTCQYCGRISPQIVLEIDHIIPKNEGGEDNIENLTTSCFDCNRGKGKGRLREVK